MRQLNCRQDSGAGASVPCYTLRHWVSLYSKLLFRQEQELQEHLHLDENITVRGVYTPIYTTVLPSWEQGGGHMEGKGLSAKGELVTLEIFIL